MTIFDFLKFIGGLALFLYGINVMGDGLKKASGGTLETILGKISGNKVMAVLTAALVTAVMQSSSATTVMIVGFVNSGLMKLANSVLLIMGANIGATITPWVMSLSSISGGESLILGLLKPTSFAPVLGIIGVFYILISKNQKRKDYAQIFVAFSILMFGMSTMSGAVEPLSSSAKFSEVMMMFSNPILGTLVGVTLTAMIQSSSATIGMVQALSTSGLITYGTAIPLMFGANIGTCATALLSSIGTSRNARRSALIHLFYNIIRVILLLTVFYTINHFVKFAFLGENATAVGIAAIDTISSIISAAVLMPFYKLFAKLTYVIVPEIEEEKEEAALNTKAPIAVLDPVFLRSPGFAVKQCMHALLDMADYTRDALFKAMSLLTEYNPKLIKQVYDLEDMVDHYEDELGKYLVKLSVMPMSDKDSTTLSMILHSIGDLERISDHAVNIADAIKEMNEKEMAGFSRKAEEEMRIFTSAVSEIVDKAFLALINQNMTIASEIEPLEEVIDDINTTIKKHHVKRLRKGKCSIEMGFVLSDISTSYERIADHCNNIAISILQKDEDIRGHEFHQAMNEKNAQTFEERYNFYSEKYALPKKGSADNSGDNSGDNFGDSSSVAADGDEAYANVAEYGVVSEMK